MERAPIIGALSSAFATSGGGLAPSVRVHPIARAFGRRAGRALGATGGEDEDGRGGRNRLEDGTLHGRLLEYRP